VRFEGARLQGWVSVTNTRGVVVLQDEAIEQPARCFLQEAREDMAAGGLGGTMDGGHGDPQPARLHAVEQSQPELR